MQFNQSKKPMPTIIAHRGESNLAPENTMAAFDLAWQLGDQAIELDVHLTRDQKVIVSHDADTWRTTGQKQRLIIHESAADELQQLDVGTWKSAEFAGEKMPLLSQVLQKMPAKKIVFVEIKPPGIQTVQAVMSTLQESGTPNDGIRIVSFHPDSIADFKRLYPTGPEAFLLASFSKDAGTGTWTPTAEQLITRARGCHADGLDLQNAEPMNAVFIRKIHAANLKCCVWTEDDPTAARRFADDGVDGITTNRAHWIGQQLKLQ